MFCECDVNCFMLSRGDTFRFPITINCGTKLDPKIYELKQKDTLYIAILEPGQSFENAIIRQTLTTENADEETGAITFNIEPISTYAIRKNREGSSEYYGKLFYADITELGNLPDTEIGEVLLTDKTPENLTYPHIQPNILNKINDYRKSKNLEALKIL